MENASVASCSKAKFAKKKVSAKSPNSNFVVEASSAVQTILYIFIIMLAGAGGFLLYQREKVKRDQQELFQNRNGYDQARGNDYA